MASTIPLFPNEPEMDYGWNIVLSDEERERFRDELRAADALERWIKGKDQ